MGSLRVLAVAVAAGAVVGLAGCSAPPSSLPSPQPSSQPAPLTSIPAAVPAGAPGAAPVVAPAAQVVAPVAASAPEQAADPVRIRIPAIGVDAPVGPLEIDPAGALPAPATNEGTGWWRAGPEPGEIGPAVVVGHVDSYQGPAVFFRLRDITPGEQVHVDRADGSTVAFTVDRVEQHSKDAFPTDRVYSDTPGSELRLVTCGGPFDRGARSYLDNVVVYAHRTP